MENFEKMSDEEPIWEEVFTRCDEIPPKVYDNDYKCGCYGYITYKGNIYPVYTDDNGCQDFIIYRYIDEKGEIKEYEIAVMNMAGILDWWYELNKMKDLHPNEVSFELKGAKV